MQITSLGGLSGSTSLIAAGGSTALSAAVSTGTVGAYSQSYTVGVSDDQSLAGDTALASQTFTVTGSVLDHALASLSSNSVELRHVLIGAKINRDRRICKTPRATGPACRSPAWAA